MFDKIAEFTRAAGNAPDKRRAMTLQETEWLVKMVFDECFEFLVTRDTPENARDTMINIAKTAKVPNKLDFDDEDAVLVEQIDACIDIVYYVGDAASRAGIELAPCFDAVHAANMAKRNPETGVFDRRFDGKIIKPEGWVEPDLKKVLFQS